MTTKTKICFIIPSLEAGGAERIVSILAKNLNKETHEVTVVTLNGSNSFFKFTPEDHVKTIQWNFKKVRRALPKVLIYLWKNKPDIVFSSITHLNTLMCMIKPLFPKNTSLIIRETSVINSPLIKQNIAKQVHKLQNKYYHRANGIISQSQHMYDEILDLQRTEKKNIHLINNPVDIPNKEIVDHCYDFIAVGNLSPVKGYDRMIKAFSLLKDKTLRLGIIGEGVERGRLEQLIEKTKTKNRISLLGRKQNPSAYIKNARIILMTSYSEGFPNALLEAGACGKPVVVFDAPGGIKEYVMNGINGFLVPNGDLENFAEKILEALNYPFIESAIQKNTLDKFGIKSIMNQYEVLFDSIIHNE